MKQQGNTQQIVVFKLGQEEYGLRIDQIREVVITPHITKMPQTPAFMKGVANIRGNIIAILDLENKFGLEQPEGSDKKEKNFTLVIESDEYKMGILVHEVPNTLSIAASDVSDSLFSGDQPEQAYVTGIVKSEKRLIIMLDIFKVINDKEAQQLFKQGNEQPVPA